MRYSQMFIPTLRENPAEAEVISHKLMLRAGMLRKLAAGIYSHLPLGQRVLRKLEKIIREEMERAGAQEVFLPSVQPAEIWIESGRWELYGKELLRFKDRNGRDFCLGPTHEEVITDLVRRETRSYRQLPLILYQIQTKFRDEIRPRFGLMRAREFAMKDAYSFDLDEEGAEESYQKMFRAYQRIFQRCGLEFRAVEADTGPIGGSFSHEFMVLADTGEDTLVSCNTCGYAANLEKAETKKPELEKEEAKSFLWKELKKAYTPGMKKVEEVAQFLKVETKDLIKTIIFQSHQGPVAALIRGDQEINEVKLKNFLKSDYLRLAEEEEIEKITGAPQGFSGPLGLKIKIIADYSLKGMFNFVTGGNEKDIHFLQVNIERDFQVEDYADLRIVKEGDPCPRCPGQLKLSKGIEVGHLFKLGTKYSEALKATYLDPQGKERLIIMGCYGIGVGRTVAAAIEQNHDQDGIIFPLPLSPFQILVLPLNAEEKKTMKLAQEIYSLLKKKGLEVLLDDRGERAGIKFKDADLIGIPIQVILGPRALKEGKIEIKLRKGNKKDLISLPEVVDKAEEMVRKGLKL